MTTDPQSESRIARKERALLSEGKERAKELLDLLGDWPVPGVDTRELLRLKHRLSRWANGHVK